MLCLFADHTYAPAGVQVRTTAAPTIIQAGVADNVLPQTGTININFRLLPGDTADTVVQYLQQVIST